MDDTRQNKFTEEQNAALNVIWMDSKKLEAFIEVTYVAMDRCKEEKFLYQMAVLSDWMREYTSQISALIGKWGVLS